MAYKVYCYTNTINGKKYIGITRTTLKERAGSNGHRYSGCLKFVSAIKKYGFGNFESKILFDGLSKKEAEQKEIELIKKYNTTNNKFGYNISTGGGIAVITEESKRKLSETKKEYYKTHKPWNFGKKGVCVPWNKGIKIKDIKPDWESPNTGRSMTKEQKNKISKTKKEYYKTHFNWRKGQKLGYVPGNARKIMCVETKEVFDSIAEAGRKYKQKSNAAICMCCKGCRNLAAGLHWIYITGEKND